MIHRTELLARLHHQSFDVLIIGGGIVGAGIARDAAMRGWRVALVEQGDFASGTSSKSSKLIHGGLRYLEHGQLRLVADCLRERHVLRTIASDLVRPLPLMLPVYRGDARALWKIAVGLWLYDRLAGSDRIRPHRILSEQAAKRLEPRIATTDLRGAGVYLDCVMDDARLCLANHLQAIAFGAVCCNYARVLALEKRSGQLAGAVVEDALTGARMAVRASVVVNATGPWADRVRRLSDKDASTRVAPTKGSHVLVPRIADHALFIQARRDRRMIFLLPWGECTLIGTTESPDVADPAALYATRDEVGYLLAETNRLLPDANLRDTDVVGSFSGARPLLAFSGPSTAASREHCIETDRFGLVSVMGGKYTTYRAMAAQAVDAIHARWKLRVSRCLTDQVNLIEPNHRVALDRWDALTKRLEPALLARWLARYGVGTFHILRAVEFEPNLLEPVCAHHDITRAELVYAIQEEMACTVSDLLVRRTRIAYSRCHGLEVMPVVRDLLQRYGRHSREVVDAQVADYHRTLERSLAFRSWGGSERTAPGLAPVLLS